MMSVPIMTCIGRLSPTSRSSASAVRIQHEKSRPLLITPDRAVLKSVLIILVTTPWIRLLRTANRTLSMSGSCRAPACNIVLVPLSTSTFRRRSSRMNRDFPDGSSHAPNTVAQPLPSDNDDHLVRVPLFGRSWSPTSDPLRIGPTELHEPSSNCLIGDVETPLGEHVRDVPKAQRKTTIEPNGMLDDDR